MGMYNIPTGTCNLEIMGYPFFAESVSPNEAFRRREYNWNSIVGGTAKVTPGAYVGLDFSITTHVFIDPDRPDEHNSIFQEMMSKPVEVVSPEIGGSFNANVVIKPERDKLNSLKLTINIKEIPDSKSLIPGEEFTVPAGRDVEEDKETKTDSKTKNKNTKKTKGTSNSNSKYMNEAQKMLKQLKSKNKNVPKKTKSNTNTWGKRK